MTPRSINALIITVEGFLDDASMPFRFDSAEHNDTAANAAVAVMEIELPAIDYTDDASSFWEISQIQIDWSFTFHAQQPTTLTSADAVDFVIESKPLGAQNWSRSIAKRDSYRAASYSKLSDVQSINAQFPETQFLRVTFSIANASRWADAFEINAISLIGAAPRDEIVCDRVRFHFWAFDASDAVLAECPSITPVFGAMFGGFVRWRVTAQLLEAHKPFILALRNIALSPFFIILGALFALIVVYLLSFMLEWLLIRFDLLRQNRYAKVPLVSTKWEGYDRHRHYVTSPDDSDSDGDDGDDEREMDNVDGVGGGVPMSPRGRKRRYVARSRDRFSGCGYMSPNNLEVPEVDRIEMAVRSPILAEMEQVILKSAEKVRGKQPFDKYSARDLAKMLFQQQLSRSHSAALGSDSGS